MFTGSDRERDVYKYALTRDFTREEEDDLVGVEEGEEAEESMEAGGAEERNSNLNVNAESTEGGGTDVVTPGVPPPAPPPPPPPPPPSSHVSSHRDGGPGRGG